MKLGIVLRNMGPSSEPALLTSCARIADEVGLESLWVTDHVAIPPDDAEGSGGRYLDPLTTLAFLAGCTERIRLGTGVLILPYRRPLPTAKGVATVQELSGGRLLLGVGAGWMKPEFRALGVPREERGMRTDASLEFLERCFAGDRVEANGQPFLFKPRPPRPPIYVGGAPPHALARAARFADGWMPMGGKPEALRAPIDDLRARTARAGRPEPEVVVLTALPLGEPARAREIISAYAEVGVTRIVQGTGHYGDADAFRDTAVRLAEVA